MAWDPQTRSTAGQRSWSRLPIALVGLSVVLAVGCTSDVGIVDDGVPVGSAQDATIDEFLSTVVPAAETLPDTGFQAMQQVVLDTGTVEWLWLDYRPNAQQSDYPVPGTWSVVEAVEFADAEEPGLRLSANIVTGDSLYTTQFTQPETQSDSTWTAQPRPPTDLGMFPLQLLAIQLDQIEDYYRTVSQEFSAELTQQGTEDGGSIWSASHSASPGISVTETLGIDPDGHLRTYEYQVSRSGSSETTDTGQPPEPASAGTATIRFSPQPNDAPHTAPEVGTTLHLETFELPPEFPVDG